MEEPKNKATLTVEVEDLATPKLLEIQEGLKVIKRIIDAHNSLQKNKRLKKLAGLIGTLALAGYGVYWFFHGNPFNSMCCFLAAILDVQIRRYLE